MGDDRRGLRGLVVNLREVDRADVEVWDAVAAGLMVSVARRVVVPLERWVPLSEHERRWLEVYAAGRTSRGGGSGRTIRRQTAGHVGCSTDPRNN